MNYPKPPMMSAKRRKILSHMVWLDRFEMSVILDAVDFYEKTATNPLNPKLATMLNVREKIALARYGKVRKLDMPAIRAGKRTPQGSRQHKPAQTARANKKKGS